MRVRFDEKSYAEKMRDADGYNNKFSYPDLPIYAKWVKYNELQKIGKDYDTVTADELEKIEKTVKTAVIDYGEKHIICFNPVIDFKEVNYAVDVTRRYKLKIPYPLPITEKEWNTIQTVENENYRKVLFVMLIDSKYYRYFNASLTRKVEVDENTVFYCQTDDAERFKIAKVKFKSKEEKIGCYYTLGQLGLIGFKFGKVDYDYVTFVDISDENVIDYITDYDHLDLHYRKLCGENITKCQICNRLVVQNKNGTKLYCNEHKGYNKKDLRIGICVDCGKEYTAAPNNMTKIRCDECQKIYRNNSQKELMKTRRNPSC